MQTVFFCTKFSRTSTGLSKRESGGLWKPEGCAEGGNFRQEGQKCSRVSLK